MSSRSERPTPYAWDRGECLALARQSCVHCFGLGLRPGRAGTSTPCYCVLRAVFRACYRRFVTCSRKDKPVSRVNLTDSDVGRGKCVWGLRNEEYCADFCLVSRRVLSDEHAYRLFKFHYLLGAEWPLCGRRLNIGRGEFFHACYRIEQKLGRAFRELKPYPLYPLRGYFAGEVDTRRAASAFPVHSEAEPEAAWRSPLSFPRPERPEAA